MRMYGSEITLTDTDSLGHGHFGTRTDTDLSDTGGHGLFRTRTDTDLEVVIGKWWGDDYI